MKIKRWVYFCLSLIMLGAEILIGAFAHGFIRNYVGDVLIVVLIFSIIRIFFVEKPKLLALYVMAFAFFVELLQLIRFFGLINESTPEIIQIIAGSTFSLEDLLSYAVGTVLCVITEKIISKYIKKG